MPDEHHTWIIDAIEEDVASIEEDGERMRQLPVWMLPPGAREGTVLAVVRSHQNDGANRLTVAIDQPAMERLRSDGSRRNRPRNPADRGGDVVL